MPSKLPKPCAHPGCPALTAERYCERHRKQEAQRHDKERGTAAARGYYGRWQRARAAYLAKHPLCAECERQNRLTPATVVDHKTPHRGDMALFWDSENWQALCKPCHDKKTAKEDGGFGNG